MPASTESLIDRRRLRKKLTFWRILTLVILVGFLVAGMGATGLFDKLGEKSRDHIARVKINGVITNDQPMIDLLAKLKRDDSVKGVVLKISSPGGSTVGGEALFEAVRDLAQKKPVASSIGTLAASAGYMVASASDHIVSRKSSIVGSIGVLFQYADASQLLDKIGVSIKAIKSSPMKAEPSPFQPASEEAKAMINKVIQDSYQWFVSLVVERRKMTKAQVLVLADGSVFTGNQGLKNGLVDAIGDENTARKWMVDEKSVESGLKLITWKPIREGDGLFANPAAMNPLVLWAMRQMGINPNNGLTNQLQRHLFLDGLTSIWLNSSGGVKN